MAEQFIETRTPDQLPRATSISPNALVTVQEEGGPVVALAVKQLLGRLIQTDTVKETRVGLLAELGHDESSVGLVYADPDPAKNGWYRKVGASGVGTWTQFEKLSAYAAAEIAGYVAQASNSATAAGLARDQAADLVLPANIFIDVPLATAEAAVANGTAFKLVDSGTGLVSVRRRTPGGSNLLYQEATTAALAPLVDLPNGRIRTQNGTAAAPAVGFASHNNLGLFLAAANQLGFAAGGSEIARMDATMKALWLGSPTGNARFVVNTNATDMMRAFEVFNKSNQLDPANQLPGFALHHYTHATAFNLDFVSDGIGLALRQSHNASARPDMPSTYVGTGPFLDFQRARVPATGGNMGGGLDRLLFFDGGGRQRFYGVNGGEWDGNAPTAPLGFGTYGNFLSRMLYMGYSNPLSKGIIGCIDQALGQFTSLDIAALALRPIGNNAVSLGSLSLGWKDAFFVNAATVTSDARSKKWRELSLVEQSKQMPNLTEAEVRAGLRIVDELGFYQWKSEIDVKGDDGARLHFGVRAQEVWRIMADEGLIDALDPVYEADWERPLRRTGNKRSKPPKPSSHYGFLCFEETERETDSVMYDVARQIEIEIEEESSLIDPSTNVPFMVKRMVPATIDQPTPAKRRKVLSPAGNKFGIRSEELTMFLMAAQEARNAETRTELASLRADIAALKAVA